MNVVLKHKHVKRVLLIQPWRDTRSKVFGEMEPYALMTLAASLVKIGVDVKVLDLRKEKKSLQPLLKSFNPQLTGITAITIDYQMAILTARIIKEYNNEIITVIGGIHATLSPSDFKIENIDFIIRGPGAIPLTMLIKHINQKLDISTIDGIIYKDEKQSFIENKLWTKNILPEAINVIPTRTVFNQKYKYRCFGFNYAIISTSQGCLGRCNFCACWRAMNGNYIQKPIKTILQEVETALKSGKRHIFFADDNTFQNVDRAFEIGKHIRDYLEQEKHKVIFDAYCRSDVIAKNPELFEFWHKIGLKFLIVGFESIFDEDLRGFNKNTAIATNLKANQILRKIGIINMAHILIRPQFLKQDFKNLNTFMYLHGITNPVLPVLTGLPGTNLYNKKNTPELYPYFDLAHPMEKTALPVNDFFKELRLIGYKNYSFTRWFSGKIKQVLNFIFTTIGIKPPYNWYETKTTHFLTIPYYKYFYWRNTNKRKLKDFYQYYLFYYEKQS